MSNTTHSLIGAAAVIALAFVVVAGITLWNPQTTNDNTLAVGNLSGSFQKTITTQSEGLAADFGNGSISFAADETGNQKRLVSVTGKVIKSVSPDQAIIVFSVETLDKSASKSQSDNAKTTTDVLNALKAAGVAEQDIKTVGYNLNEEFEWNETTRKSESTGYRTSHSIQVTLHDLTQTGKVVDAAAQAGANRVNSVTFSLSNAKEDELRTQALQEAAQNARTKATSIATGLGVTLGQVFSASESSSYSTPYYYDRMEKTMAGAAQDSAVPSTPITSGDVEFSAMVSVQFEIQ